MDIRRAALVAALAMTGLCTAFAQVEGVAGADGHFARGAAMYAEGRYAAAEAELAEALALDPDAAGAEDARLMAAASRYRLGKCGVGELDGLLRDYPGTAWRNLLSFMAGDILFREGKYEKACTRLGNCDVFALAEADCEQALYAMAVSCQRTGRMEEAKVNYATLAATSARYGEDARYNLGQILYGQGRYGEALDEFESLERSDRFSRRAMTRAADICLRLGRTDDAIATADRLIASSGGSEGDAELYKIKGAALYAQGDMAGAAKTLAAYSRMADRPEREAMYMLGMARYSVGAYAKAAEALTASAVADDAMSQNAWLHAGLARLALADNDRARLAFERASSMDFDSEVAAQALYNYGICVSVAAYSPFNESVKVFERLLNDYPGSTYAGLASGRLVDAYLATSNYEEALESLDKIKNPGASLLAAKQKLLFRLGLQRFSNGDYDLAVQSFTASLALGRYDGEVRAEAYFWRGESRYRTGDMGGADTDFRLYAEYAPDKTGRTFALACYNLGYISFKGKAYGKALGYFKRCETLAATLPDDVRADLCNRMGDCYYRQRDFAMAEDFYARAAATDPGQGDYALFQRAFILGLQKDYSAKISTLDRLLADYHSSPYRDDAMFERGRAYVMMDDTRRAIDCYRTLVAEHPTSSYAQRAAAETAMLLYRSGQLEAAAEAYKAVITGYPGSAEAGQAARDLQSLYVEMNRVDDYFAFAAAAGLGAGQGDGQRDSLTYLAAERIYMTGDKAAGTRALEGYLADFPAGAFAANADYYAGLYYYNQGNHDKALEHLARFTDAAAGRFTPEALTMVAQMLHDRGEYARAAETYTKLRDMASTEEDAIAAETGLMRCHAASGDHRLTAEAATALLAHAKTDPQTAIEAHRQRAKARTAMSMTQEALDDWRAISGDTRTEAGAEARYRTAEILFGNGDNGAAEAEIMSFIADGTPHSYWMARAFLLLADIYAAEGKGDDARQYLLSLKQNYTADDDIALMIEERLAKLNN